MNILTKVMGVVYSVPSEIYFSSSTGTSYSNLGAMLKQELGDSIPTLVNGKNSVASFLPFRALTIGIED